MFSTHCLPSFSRVLSGLAIVATLIVTSTGSFGQEPVVLRGHQGAVLMAAFAAENDRIVTASADQTARLWDRATGMTIAEFTQHTGPLYCLAVSADGRTLVTGAQDNTLRIWDMPLSRPIQTLAEASGAFTDFTLADEGRKLLATNTDMQTRIIEMPTTTSRTLNSPAPAIPIPVVRAAHRHPLTAVSTRPDSVAFATADQSGRMLLWSPDIVTPIGSLVGSSSPIVALGFQSNNQQLISASADGSVRTWQLMPTLPRIAATLDDAIRQMSVVPGQAVAIVGTANGACRVVDMQTGQIVREFPRSESAMTDFGISSSFAWIGIATTDGTVRLHNFGDGTPRGQIGGHVGAIQDIATHPDGQRFLTAGADGTVRLWNSPLPHSLMAGHGAPIRGLSSATNGLWCVTTSDDLMTRVWNATGGATLAMGQHTQPVKAFAIRDDDAVLATGDAEGLVRIWNPTNGNADGVIRAHAAAISAIAFTPDRTAVVAAASDGLIRAWALPLPVQLPVDGTEPPAPLWEARSPDGAAVVQLETLTADRGLLALTTSGTQLIGLKADGTAAPMIQSPGGVLKSIDVTGTRDAILASADDGRIHVFGIDGALQRSLPAIVGLTSARFDRDGKRIAVTTNNPQVRIIDAATGATIEELPTPFPVTSADWLGPEQKSLAATGAGNEGVVVQQALVRTWSDFVGGATAVVCSPDQQSAIAGAADGSIRQLQLNDGAVLKTLTGHTAAVRELALSPNGQVLASVSDDLSLRIWNLNDGTQTHLIAHPKSVRSVSISADGTRAATACDDGVIRVFDSATGLLLESFVEQSEGTPAQQVRFHNDSLTLVSAGDDQTLRALRTSIIRTIPAHKSAITGLALYGGGGQIITSSTDETVALTNVGNGLRDREFITAGLQPTAVASRPDNQRIAAGCATGEVLVWNINDGSMTLQRLMPSSNAAVTSLNWSFDSRRLAVVTQDRKLTVFGPSLPGVQPSVELVPYQQISLSESGTRVAFRPDNRSMIVSLANGRIEEWSSAGPEQRRQFNHGGPVYAVAVSRDGSTVVSGSTDQTIRVWDTVTGQQKFQLNGHQGAVHAVALSADESFAVSSGADGTLRLWDVVGGRPLKQLISFDSTMYAVSIHPNGSLIAAAGADRRIHLIDLSSGTEQRVIEGHSDYIHSVTFSPDGEHILSYGYAGQLRLWNTADGRLLSEQRVGRIGNTATFSPDGRSIVLANGDCTATVMSLP